MKNLKKKLYYLLICLIIGIHFSSSTYLKHEKENSQNSLSIDHFKKPGKEHYPETWFHFIGGNVSKEGITADLEAIAAAGLSGIQLFHGQFGGEWPGVSPQIKCLSESWDELILWTADECNRLGLKLTMQNCPGWSYAGGPWIEPENAMRHLVQSRTDIIGGQMVNAPLDIPQPSDEDWRDYKDLFVIAFPTPEGDTGKQLTPDFIQSSRPTLPWKECLQQKKKLTLPPSLSEPTTIDVSFKNEVTVRTVELPPVNSFSHAWSYSPDITIGIYAIFGDKKEQIAHLKMPQGSWQDDRPITIACEETSAQTYRIEISNLHDMELSYINFYSAARQQNWESEAAWTLRSIVREDYPKQSIGAWVDPSSIIDISEKINQEGILTWDAPEGKWTVLRIGHVNTGMKNGPAPLEATGWECNKLDPSGARANFDGYIGRLINDNTSLKDGLLNGILIDSWECKTQTWTNNLHNIFREKWDYSLFSMFPALFGYVVDNPEMTGRFLRDWRVTLNDLLVKNFFGEMSGIARENGLKISFETASGDIFPGDILEYYKYADIPMCEFWQPKQESYVGSLEFKPVKPCVSAARVYGKKRVAAEAFTSFELTWNEHPRFLKDRADEHLARGVTHMVFHTYTHNPRTDFLPPSTSFGSNIGTPFLRLQTWWEHMPYFTDYLARCNYMLESGLPVSDVLMYLGDEQNHKPQQLLDFPEGYAYDYCNTDVLLNRLSVKNGQLVTPEGISYSVLWLYDCKRLVPETIEKILSFAKQGVTIVGEPPVGIATLSGGKSIEKRFKKAVQSLWGDGSQWVRKVGQGKVYNCEISTALQSQNIKPDISLNFSDVRWLHRKTNDSNIYFLSAPEEKGFNGKVSFRCKGKAEIWDPVTGEMHEIISKSTQDGYTEMMIDLMAGTSCFIVFDEESASPSKEQYVVLTDHQSNPRNLLSAQDDDLSPHRVAHSKRKKLQSELEMRKLSADNQSATFQNQNSQDHKQLIQENAVQLNKWQISFPFGWGIDPSSFDINQLIAWKDINSLTEEGKAFSGTVLYRTSFHSDDLSYFKKLSDESKFLIDLGRVEMIAKVWLNGSEVATKWTYPYTIDITKYIQQGDNKLEISVTSTWFNRLVYDAGISEQARKTWTINGPKSGSPLKEYGLLGPVKIGIQ